MKNELCENIMTEFAALRAKLYSYNSLTEKGEDRKAKGAKKCVSITFNYYKLWLDKGIDVYASQVLIQNKKHKVFTCEVTKLALNRADDMRLVQADQVTHWQGVIMVKDQVDILDKVDVHLHQTQKFRG